ncbi:MAG: hypothetical protein ETSY2_15180 [Candidatus Entotheonella gemina]|uniref:Sodium/calcium exchanger membrane region domain-containing protein n=1 Tax=Candidatus Entotheonella gemina TaxID=1429439 RepID=W4MA30_9BACT|nr:MAG: hypothetical protein ETSY2_15180 [Candidatus Entotheonella gemina]
MMIALGCLTIIALAIYLLAVITDEFFIPSLDRFAQRFQLPGSVAGASLMAMGSSAPELSIALLSLFKAGGAHSDVGIGTIVGSAVFNILVITGVSAIVQPAHVSWRVVVRDVVMYVASIALLLATFADGRITVAEALAFLVLYGVYLFILFQWETASPIEMTDGVAVSERTTPTHSSGWLYRAHMLVITAMGRLTGHAHITYIRAFLVSVAVIAVISWVLVDVAVVLAGAIGLPPVIVALTILAGGTSVPDMMASIIVARQGRGEMAIVNAIGSNIFDILVGLGLPWLIVLAIRGKTVQVGTGELWFSTLVLLSTVVLLYIFLTTGRRLSRREGWVLLGVYTAYVLWTWLGS